AVGKGFVPEFLVEIEIVVVGAREERRAGREFQDEPVSQVQGTRQVVPGREQHDSTGGGGIDGGLDGRGVVGLSVASGAVIADAARPGRAPGWKRPRSDPGDGEETGTSQKSPAR